MEKFTGGTLDVMEWLSNNKESSMNLYCTKVCNRHGMVVGRIIYYYS